jgi:hypothetical protein
MTNSNAKKTWNNPIKKSMNKQQFKKDLILPEWFVGGEQLRWNEERQDQHVNERSIS